MDRATQDELGEIARNLRTHLEWMRDLGLPGMRVSITAASQSAPASKPATASMARVEPRAEAPKPAGAPEPPKPSVSAEMARAFLQKPKTQPAAHTPTPRAHVDSAMAVEPARATSVAHPARTVHAEPKVVSEPVAVPPRALFESEVPAPRVRIAGEPVLEGQARVEALAVLQEAVTGCTRCRLAEKRNNTVFSRGNPFARLAFVGEGPGRDEDLQGKPFVGAAGQLLDKILGAMGMSEGDVYIGNVVKCRPPENRVPLPDEMQTCGPFLLRQLGLVRPEVIVALGRTAANHLLENDLSMSRMRGKWHDLDGIPLLATWHPAYLLRNPAAKGETWDDMKKVLGRLNLAVPAPRK